MNYKHLIKFVLLSVCLFIFLTPTNTEARTVKYLEGGKFTDGRALVPMRAIFEELGANVRYSAYDKRVHAWNQDVELYLYLWDSVSYVNGYSRYLDVPVQMDNDTNRTLVPLRFVSETLGATVKWDQKTSTATVLSKDKELRIKVNTKQKFNNDINIYFSINRYGEIDSNYYNGYEFSLLRGQKVTAIQTNGSYTRFLIAGMSLDFDYNNPSNPNRAVRLNTTGYSGMTELMIVPNYWDWDESYSYYFYR
ncbi:copper amine oxidase N-terminal domain-containing protein [Alkalihalophilus marmarensis]|uniref:copper amine oxidase N-terminal domain-containing protein n=1 Tax=Alkalihalophilus marmarensis TaxID=521377 RepID=UPI00203AB57D|nr:copper amine oxidase N-terminal domain-containing protein [Alkalihalophilus marmarensis]MCM3489994.1 copper amine oxidase N-terminal domain-containing protein [Alkalihalophilus marmarensis]